MQQVNRLATPESVRHHALVTDWPYPVDGQVPSPPTVAAWAQLELLPVEKMPLWAAHWLTAGYDGGHLVYLAGLHSDETREIRDVLPDALRDCGTLMPESDVVAATVVFTHVARLHAAGQGSARWVAQKVEEVLMKSGYSESVIALPLGHLYCIADEWAEHWGRTDEQLTRLVHEACEEQLRSGSIAT
jgi:hypothetical protein